jgi:DNA-binding NarL/FixJ family response regulator
VLADCVSLEVVGSDTFDCAGLANAVAACPDIVLANGAALCGDDAFPQLQFPSHSRIVALGIVDHERQVVAGAERGIVGFLPLEARVEDVIAAIHATARGEFRCSRRGVAAMASRLSILATRATEQAGPVLTLREEEVLGLVDQGLSNKEIAGRLRVEVSTVKNHVHNLLQKLQVPRRGRASAVFRRLTQATSQH